MQRLVAAALPVVEGRQGLVVAEGQRGSMDTQASPVGRCSRECDDLACGMV